MAADDLDALIWNVSDAAAAFIRGDMTTYLELIEHTEDYTLMPPGGGKPVRGFDGSPAAVEAMERFFGGPGEATLEVVEAYASADLAVLVGIERQHGVIDGAPDQDWSLRVTLVFRREGARWRLAHRHADPLVHPISHAQVAALARGDKPGRSADKPGESADKPGKPGDKPGKPGVKSGKSGAKPGRKRNK